MNQIDNDAVFKSILDDLEFSHIVEMSKNNSDGRRYRYCNRYTTPISFYNYTIYRDIEINFFYLLKIYLFFIRNLRILKYQYGIT